MTPGFILILFVYAAGLSIGQILFKLSAEIARRQGDNFIKALLFEPRFILAIALYGALTLLWTWILSKVPLSRAYPFVALAFALTPILANTYLGENITTGIWLGTALILAGLFIVVYSN
ncbi:MAG TPA: EamA family transporter [Accumulibacter sp.]|jgi:drug/metabolite transporter (DMT)-like permease|nr:EamA family transporter [Accumulibacter sp.]